MGHEADQVGERRAAADGVGQNEQAHDDQDRHRRRPRPQPPRADQLIEGKQQRRGLAVVALLEEGIEMKSDGRQTDEAEHQGRAHAAFEPIERRGRELRRQLRNARIGEARNGRCPDRQYAFRRQVGLLDHFREHLGEDAGVGNRTERMPVVGDSPRSGSAAAPRTIRAPSAGTRTAAIRHAAAPEHQRKQEAGASADRDAKDGERHRPHHADHFDGEKVRPDQARRQARISAHGLSALTARWRARAQRQRPTEIGPLRSDSRASVV